ncbi:MAG: hypothetical protein FJX72_18160, partial [Armatimonadetes bacterium]|nr:hypothetical protein [Armatimonadota bacterium]
MRTGPAPGESAKADRRTFEEWIASGAIPLGGTVISVEKGEATAPGRPQPTAVVTAVWGDGRATFAAEFRAQSNPGSVDVAILQARRTAEETGLAPMVIVPYLSEERLLELERQGVSGLDLSGNGLLLAEGFRVWQSGRPNLFRDSGPIRNPMAGDSSVFVRCFLLQREFASLTGLRDFAASKALLPADGPGSPLRLGTASKVVKRLRDDRLVKKVGLSLRLDDARGLLTALRDAHRPETGRRRITGRSRLGPEAIRQKLASARAETGLRWAPTGLSSAAFHGALFGIEHLSLYVDDAGAAADTLDIEEGRAFANVTLIETSRHLVYFDLRPDGDALWASPIQTWLEP